MVILLLKESLDILVIYSFFPESIRFDISSKKVIPYREIKKDLFFTIKTITT